LITSDCTQIGADGDHRKLFSGLEAQGALYTSSARFAFLILLIQLSKSYVEAHLNRLASMRK
jgi:hypothetical protein